MGIVTRKAKNCYNWKGFTQIVSKLNDLREKAQSDLYGTPDDFRTPIPSRKPSKKPSGRSRSDNCSLDAADTQSRSESQTPFPSSLETEPDLEQRPRSRPVGGSRKEKSLGVLSQRFVQLFLLAGVKAVSLDQAAIQLLGRSPCDADPLAISPAEGDASKLLKTKVRRLYDIANILSSLQLIEKVHTANRKPAFTWLGPDSSSSAVMALQTNGTARQATEAAVESLKRQAPDDADRARAAIKRKKPFSRRSVQSPCKEKREEGAKGELGSQGSPGKIENAGFDEETVGQLDGILETFPESYAKRWREYVNSVNGMLVRGQVTREKAYESISSVLSQAKESNGGTNTKSEDVGEKQLMAAQQLSALATTGGKSRGGGDGELNENISQVKTEAVKVGNFGGPHGSPVTRSTEEEMGIVKRAVANGGDSTSMGSTMTYQSGACQGNGGGAYVGGMGWPWTQAYVASYMKDAAAAGPEYVRAAEQWLASLQQWQTMWASSLSVFNSVHVTMQNTSEHMQPRKLLPLLQSNDDDESCLQS